MNGLWTDAIYTVAAAMAKIAGTIAALLFSISYLTYAERKILAAMQLRKGPNMAGPFGLLQPLADGIKLLFKETVVPSKANAPLFIGASVFTFFIALSAWAVIPAFEGGASANINAGLLYVLAASSLGVYGIIIAGWSSNSKYPFLGGLRSAAQMVSYELSIGLAAATVVLFSGSANLGNIVAAQKEGWLVFSSAFPMFFVFFISALAETNRHPFDIPEGESELVGGFNTEYSSMAFALFFLGEYANMILMSAMATLLFLGGWLPPFEALDVVPGFFWFAGKTALCLFVFIWARATLPRFRYDKLMSFGWKRLLPFSFLWFVAVSGYLLYFGKLPEGGCACG